MAATVKFDLKPSRPTLPCPFCGQPPVIEPCPTGGIRLRHRGWGEGSKPDDCILHARAMTTGASANEVNHRWNRRAAAPVEEPPMIGEPII